MTERERLFAALKGQPVDRVPIWLLFPYHFRACYVDVRTNPCYVPIFEKSKECAVMLDRRTTKARLFAPGVEEKWEKVDEDGWVGHRYTLSFEGRSLSGWTLRRGEEVRVKRALATEADLDTLLTIPLNTDPVQVRKEMAAHTEPHLAERANFPIDYGATMLDLSEPIAFIYANADLTEFPIWSIECPEKVERFLDEAMKVHRLIYAYTLEQDWGDVYFMVGSELASPPLVGRSTFQRWIVPYAKELIDMIHAQGKFVIQHYHGQIKLILEDFLTMGADALHTIESPPTGNCTLTGAFDVVKNKLTLIGNVQYDLFRSLTPEEMREEVRRVLEEVDGRRFILSPSAGPYEPMISQRMIDNYMAFMDAGVEYGRVYNRPRKRPAAV